MIFNILTKNNNTSEKRLMIDIRDTLEAYNNRDISNISRTHTLCTSRKIVKHCTNYSWSFSLQIASVLWYLQASPKDTPYQTCSIVANPQLQDR